MTLLEFSAVVFAGSVTAGLLGSLTGLGGGIVVIPLLTLGFGVDIRYAAGAALVSVIATSSGAASSYVKEGYSNLRIGMFLEVATTSGAVAGALLAADLPESAISLLFGVVLLLSSALSLREPARGDDGAASDPIARRLRLDGTYPSPEGRIAYHVHGTKTAFGLMFVAGSLSGLLGIGSGAVKVLALDRAMGLPFKVSTTTSNFMIGVTAAASAGIYLARGYIDPGLAMPVMLGVLVGALVGARLLARVESRSLRVLFAAVIALLGLQMIHGGISGSPP
ncbi:MAG: sulfite exporter TauE/SafE family protein [Deltaproteobacteria bacterium]|nr:sulfite exporter TauE/SafE family protein [Deltaproteobacteria bacterium]